MKITYKPVENPATKNALEIVISESTTGGNDQEVWGVNFNYLPEGVDTKDKAENFLKGFFHIEAIINKSRKGYGDTYDSVDFEDETGEIEDIEVDSDGFISFTCGGYEFEYWFSFDASMPTEDGHYFAGIKFDSAFYYDENGDKFQICIEQ